MHIVIAVLYGFVFWLSCLAYTLIVGGRWGLVAALMPMFVSGAATVLLILDGVIGALWKAWRPRKPVAPVRSSNR